MLKDNEKKNFSRLHMIIDAIVLVLSYFLAWLIRFVGPMAATAVRTKLSAVYADAGFYCTGLSVVVSGFHIVYSHADAGRRLVLANIVKANSLGLLILMFTFYMIDESDFSPFYLYYVLCN